MNVHIVVECWGYGPGDIVLSPFQSREAAEKHWESLVRADLAGSDRTFELVISRCKEQNFCYHYERGYFAVVTSELK